MFPTTVNEEAPAEASPPYAKQSFQSWKEYVDGEHIYTYEDEDTQLNAEYDLVNNHILTYLFCANSFEDLDEALSGILWTHSLAQTLFDALNDDNWSEETNRDGLMKEAHEKASACAATMGFFVGAPSGPSATRHEEGSLYPFIVDLGMLNIMAPSLMQALGFTEQPFYSMSPIFPRVDIMNTVC